MGRLSLLVVLVAVMAVSCTGRRPPAKDSTKMKHANGLTVLLPAGNLTAEETSAGYIVRPENWRSLRSPKEIRIEVRDVQPAGNWPSVMQMNGVALKYRMDSREGGSGGEERVLEAWKPSGNRWIWMSESVQSETRSESAFADGWFVLDSASLSGS